MICSTRDNSDLKSAADHGLESHSGQNCPYSAADHGLESHSGQNCPDSAADHGLESHSGQNYQFWPEWDSNP
jgi:hypothetical protein